MKTTYEFYVAATEGAEPRFVPVPCESDREIVSRARELLAAHSAAAVEVRRDGQVLFQLLA
jgi:hypothetical protein